MAASPPIISAIPSADAEANAGARRFYVDKESKFYTCGKDFWGNYGSNSASTAGYFIFDGHILEGLSLMGSRAGNTCMIILETSANCMGRKQLKVSKQLAILKFATEGQVFDKSCKTFDDLVARLLKFQRKNPDSAELITQWSDFEDTEGAAVLVARGSERKLERLMATPILFPACDTSNRTAGELVLLMGPRYTNAIRQDVSLNWSLVISTVFNLTLADNKNLAKAKDVALLAQLIEPTLHRLQLPSQTSIFAASPVGALATLSAKVQWMTTPSADRETWFWEHFNRFSNRLPALKCLVKELPPELDTALTLRECAVSRLGGKASRAPVDLLLALEANLGANLQATKQLVKRRPVEDMLRALGKTNSGSDGRREEPEEAEKSLRTGKLVLSSDAVRDVVESKPFLSCEEKLNPLLKGTRDAGNINNLFAALSAVGLLICWQMLLRHPTLRSTHAFLNTVSGLKPYLLTRISYMLVCNVEKKVRKGFAQTYLYPKSEFDLFAAGRHAEMQHYVKGYLGTLAAIRKASGGLAEGTSEMDWLYDGDEYKGMTDYMARLTLALGYNSKPTEGSSIDDFFVLFGKYRAYISEMPIAEQQRMYDQLADWWHAAMLEGGEYLVLQLDDISPADKRLEGYLGAASKTSGVLCQIQDALDAFDDVESFRRKAPHMFDGRTTFVGGGLGKRAFESACASGGSPRKASKSANGAGDDGELDPSLTEKAPVIGRRGNLVKFSDDNPDYYTVSDDVYGPISELAAECKVDVKARCWPVMLSSKPPDHRCEMCPCSTTSKHTTAATGMHKPVKLPQGWRKKYMRKRAGFVIPAANGGASSGASGEAGR